MFGLGIWEIALILVIGLLVLGPEKLPKVARKLGIGVRELKKAATEFQRSLNTEVANLEEEAKEKSGLREIEALKRGGVEQIEKLEGSSDFREISDLAERAKRAKAEITGTVKGNRAGAEGSAGGPGASEGGSTGSGAGGSTGSDPSAIEDASGSASTEPAPEKPTGKDPEGS